MTTTATADSLARIPFLREERDPGGRCLSEGGRSLDNAAFAAAVRRLAGRLAELGVAPGDNVAVMLPNCAEIVTTMFAAWYGGSALTPVNPALTDDEALYQLEDSSSVVVVGDERARALAATLDIAWVDVRSIHATSERPVPPVGQPGPDDAPVAQPDDFALVIYTSGTTGRPKGVLLDHANITAMSSSLVDHFQLTAADTSLLVLPLFHANGLIAGVVSVLRAGGDVVVAPRFSPSTFWELVEEHRPTYFSAVPTMYAVLEDRTGHPVDTSSLRFAICGAAPMPADLITRFEDRFGIPVVEGYGLSEGSVASTINPLAGPRKPGTVGIALPGQEVAVVSATGEHLSTGLRGEVVIRGANVMRGYLGRPEETTKVLRDGWLHTGDVGTIDEDGYLRIVDRIKELIIRGGENIYPKEIEECLYTHPSVLEAAVVGRPDPVLGEVPVAFVAARPGLTLSEDELRGHCAVSLAPFKIPAAFHVLAELPKNAVGKLVKAQLSERAPLR
ncbi:class I adenylate-forming enzyme family protein [Nocardioides caeni]|uniref:Long-chain fatty acid--CoA ligase n=1 Tax=Nocardioides caeni TaxID=574700 RepID=A0A4V4HJ32_9ACTN|nr:AMP-binding protein [Nocardioides caeni]THV08856.1 long-chain fatty acid--CoA ligase [Nocardioides caeni]